MILQIALWEPEIPPNTGNIARLSAAIGARLHLIGRLGFRTDEKTLRRAGLDYWEHVDLQYHDTFEEFEQRVGSEQILCIETPAEKRYTEAPVRPGVCLLFGSESKGLPESVRVRYAERIFGIPMITGKIRSLNLSTAVGIVAYDALRRLQGW